jgi:hypothetical protein
VLVVGVQAHAQTIPTFPGTPGTSAQAEAVRVAAPALNTGNYRLGMPVDEAVSQLKKDDLLANPFSRPQIGIQFRQLPNHPLVGAAFGTRTGKDGGRIETVGMMFTMYPNTPVVAAVTREIRYESPAAAPSVTNTLAALRKKYGPESGTFAQNTLSWLFDYQGRPLSPVQLALLQKSQCSVIGPGLYEADNVVKQEFFGRKIASDYIETDGGVNDHVNHDPGCFRVIHLDAILGIRKPGGAAGFSGNNAFAFKPQDWVGLSDDLVQSVTIAIKDTALDYAASAATRNAVLAGGQQNEQQQINSAKKNTPNL